MNINNAEYIVLLLLESSKDDKTKMERRKTWQETAMFVVSPGEVVRGLFLLSFIL